MEPLTIISYILSSFFGYSIGADIWNQIKIKTELDELKNKLDSIHSHLNRIDSKLD
jgi:hypothetical protein